MSQVVLRPDLSHCIQTVARHEYERMARELLGGAESDALFQERMEVLRAFLETTEFAELRSRYEPYLADGRSVIFKLHTIEGRTEYEFEVE